jgi:hypothetical protein
LRVGDLVRICPPIDDDEIDDDDIVDDDEISNAVGIIVRAVVLEDGDPINRWCDWWVMVRDRLTPFAEVHLAVVRDEARSE